jgi:hypothetical protein
VSKIEKLIDILYPLNLRYKIEKIISFNDEDYFNELKERLKNNTLELYNHYIDDKKGYFHITFEKELIKDDSSLNYDEFCPYAISLIIE